MTTFNFTSGNPSNLVGGLGANMADIQGGFVDLRAFINGAHMDAVNIAPQGVTGPLLADTAVTIAKLAVGTGTRLLGFLNSDAPGTWGSGVNRFLNVGTGLTVTHTRTTAVAILLWGWRNSGGTTTTMNPQILINASPQGTMDFITTLVSGETAIHAAAQQFTVGASSQSWNAQATQGANATTVVSSGPGVLLILEQY